MSLKLTILNSVKTIPTFSFNIIVKTQKNEVNLLEPLGLSMGNISFLKEFSIKS